MCESSSWRWFDFSVLPDSVKKPCLVLQTPQKLVILLSFSLKGRGVERKQHEQFSPCFLQNYFSATRMRYKVLHTRLYASTKLDISTTHPYSRWQAARWIFMLEHVPYTLTLGHGTQATDAHIDKEGKTLSQARSTKQVRTIQESPRTVCALTPGGQLPRDVPGKPIKKTPLQYHTTAHTRARVTVPTTLNGHVTPLPQKQRHPTSAAQQSNKLPWNTLFQPKRRDKTRKKKCSYDNIPIAIYCIALYTMYSYMVHTR